MYSSARSVYDACTFLTIVQIIRSGAIAGARPVPASRTDVTQSDRYPRRPARRGD